MKRGLKLIFSFLFLFVILTNFTSASIFSDFWNKVTGNVMVSSVCGNGIVEAGEQCDGNDFPNNKIACNDWSTTHRIGIVSCDPSSCTIKTSSCIACSEEPIIPNPTEIPTQTSTPVPTPVPRPTINETSTPLPNPTQKPTANETLIANEPSVKTCGNGILDAGEQCDGTIFLRNEKRCGFWNVGSENIDGYVSCNVNTCKVDVSACVPTAHCGAKDQYCSSNSECCSGQCKLFISFPLLFLSRKKCTNPLPNCGNGILDAGEQCDGQLLGGQTCSDLGGNYVGTLRCSEECKYTGCSRARYNPEVEETENNNANSEDNSDQNVPLHQGNRPWAGQDFV